MTSFILGGGCFWCLDAVYRQLRGVSRVETGYAGGDEPNPNYYRVASGQTGHAEVVRVTFDKQIIPPDIILDIFFLIHDPTSLNRQGADKGLQYRSVMFYADETQKRQFSNAIDRVRDIWDDPIVTELSTLDEFYVAETEHQDYFNKQPASGYCSIVIYPKIIKARQAYQQWFRADG